MKKEVGFILVVVAIVVAGAISGSFTGNLAYDTSRERFESGSKSGPPGPPDFEFECVCEDPNSPNAKNCEGITDARTCVNTDCGYDITFKDPSGTVVTRHFPLDCKTYPLLECDCPAKPDDIAIGYSCTLTGNLCGKDTKICEKRLKGCKYRCTGPGGTINPIGECKSKS